MAFDGLFKQNNDSRSGKTGKDPSREIPCLPSPACTNEPLISVSGPQSNDGGITVKPAACRRVSMQFSAHFLPCHMQTGIWLFLHGTSRSGLPMIFLPFRLEPRAGFHFLHSVVWFPFTTLQQGLSRLRPAGAGKRFCVISKSNFEKTQFQLESQRKLLCFKARL